MFNNTFHTYCTEGIDAWMVRKLTEWLDDENNKEDVTYKTVGDAYYKIYGNMLYTKQKQLTPNEKEILSGWLDMAVAREMVDRFTSGGRVYEVARPGGTTGYVERFVLPYVIAKQVFCS